MYYRELLEILEEMDEKDLSRLVTIESEIIGETTDVEFDEKSFTMIAYEQ
jgi:uncharacterized protein YrrD